MPLCSSTLRGQSTVCRGIIGPVGQSPVGRHHDECCTCLLHTLCVGTGDPLESVVGIQGDAPVLLLL
jgi:hypothetical protein